MVWCSYCAKDQETENDDINGFTCCTGCGRVLDDNIYSSDPTFTKSADGQSQVQGNFIKDRQYSSYGRLGDSGSHGYGFSTDSHEKTLEKGRNEIRDIADFLAMSGKEDTVGAAHRLYTLAVERNFTRGRRTNQVAAACLYIVCRQDQKPFLLIDFADCLQTNVYVLGAVFLQLCRLLRLEQHPIMQKPVDPSLFIHRFTDRLVGRTAGHGKKFHSIANTALRLVASMKRDWMQTGRRPSGICGAALFISAHIHGFECTKTDVVSVVHICEGTLKKRLIEFEKTESGSLTADEFEARAKELELHAHMIEAPITSVEPENGKALREVLCEHKELGATHFALGLCRSCYEEFVRVSGGIQGGAAPPAFQRAEQKSMEAVRKQMREQGLLSDDEDEVKQIEGVKSGRRRPKGKVGRPGTERSEDGLGRKEADETMDISKERGGRRGSGRGIGRIKSFEDEETTELLDQMQDGKLEEGRAESVHLTVNSGQDLEAVLMEDEHAMLEKGDEAVGAQIRISKDTQESAVLIGNDAESCQKGKQSQRDVDETGVITECDQTEGQQSRGSMEDLHDALDSCVTETGQGTQDDDESLSQSCLDGAARDNEPLSDDGGTFSDIDDNEVDGYLHNQEEVRLKTIIWTEMNKEYLEEQQAKQEALAASQAAYAAALAAAGEDSASAVELAAAAAAAVAELKKDKKRKRAEAKNKGPAESAAEATRQMLQTKKLSSKVNYNALEKLFDGEDASEKANRGDDDKIKDDDKGTLDLKEKHVKWADGFTTDDSQNLGSTQQSQITTDKVAANSEEGIGEEDDDFMDNDDTVSMEDSQLSRFRLSYGQEYGDDDYDEY